MRPKRNKPKGFLAKACGIARIASAIVFILGIIALAIYVGVWVCFVGGVCQIVDGVKATPTDGVDIGLGLLRVMFAGAAGGITFVLGLFLSKITMID